MLAWNLLHPRMTPEHLGYLPDFLFEDDPRPAAVQFNERYRFGGWRPFKGFTLGKDNTLTYPGDAEVLYPIAKAKLRDELILLYQGDWVAIVQPDRSYEIARMD